MPEYERPDAAPSGQTRWFTLDRLERCYRRVYPLKIFLENARQIVVGNAVGLTIAASLFFFQSLIPSERDVSATPIEIGVFLVTAFAASVVAAYASIWNIMVRNFWKVGGLLALAVAVAIGRFLIDTGAEIVIPAAGMVSNLQTVSPFMAAMLLIVVSLTLGYYAYLIWLLVQASYALAVVNPHDRAIMRDLPRRQLSSSGFFSRFWGFPPLLKFTGKPRVRYVAIVALSVTCALFFSVATTLPVILTGPLDEVTRLAQNCGADADCSLTKLPMFLRHFLFLFMAIVVCLALGWMGQRLLQRLLRVSLKSLQEIDGRRPVVFLRAFRMIKSQ